MLTKHNSSVHKVRRLPAYRRSFYSVALVQALRFMSTLLRSYVAYVALVSYALSCRLLRRSLYSVALVKPCASSRPPSRNTQHTNRGTLASPPSSRPAWSARGARLLPRRRARRRRLHVARRPWASASPAPAPHWRTGAKSCELWGKALPPHWLWGKEMRGRGCGAIGAGCELSTSRSWCSILESSVTSSRLNTSCTRLSR